MPLLNITFIFAYESWKIILECLICTSGCHKTKALSLDSRKEKVFCLAILYVYVLIPSIVFYFV